MIDGYTAWKKQQKGATISQMFKAGYINYGSLFYDLEIEGDYDELHRKLWHTLYKKDGDPAYPWINDESIITDKDQFMMGFMYGAEMMVSTLVFWLDSPEDEPMDD